MDAAAVSLGIFFWLFVVAIGTVLYFLPTIVALTLHRRNAAAVVLINVLLGWSFVGWIVALILALTREPEPVQAVQAHTAPSPAPGHDLMELPESERHLD